MKRRATSLKPFLNITRTCEIRTWKISMKLYHSKLVSKALNFSFLRSWFKNLHFSIRRKFSELLSPFLLFWRLLLFQTLGSYYAHLELLANNIFELWIYLSYNIFRLIAFFNRDRILGNFHLHFSARLFTSVWIAITALSSAHN